MIDFSNDIVDYIKNFDKNEKSDEEKEILPKKWSCHKCSFLNDNSRVSCEICESKRIRNI